MVPETVRSFSSTASCAVSDKVQEELKEERVRVGQLRERLRHLEAELEELPLIRAQAEIYQADFNAERKAREEIAGQKADLLEEVRTLRSGPGGGGAAGPATPRVSHPTPSTPN